MKPVLEEGKSVRRPPCAEEGEAKATCDKLATVPIHIPLCHWRGEGRETGAEVESGKREVEVA